LEPWSRADAIGKEIAMIESAARERLHLPRSILQPASLPRPFPPARLALLLAGTLLSVFAVAFWFQWPIVERIWPAPLSNGAFLGAALASLAGSVFFIGWTGDFGAVRALAVTLGAVSVGFVVASLPPLAGGNLTFAPLLIGSAVAVAGSVVLFRWAQRFAEQDQRPTPPVVLWFLTIWAILLVIPGVAAIQGVDFMPTPQPIETRRLSGAVYAGAGAFVLWAIARPTWSNARLVLIAFLIYDVLRLLVLPQFLPRMLADPSGTRIAAWLSWAAVIASTLFCVAFFGASSCWRPRTLAAARSTGSERRGR
jgi:hypothetical protein